MKGYAKGTAWIPNTQVALLHEGEMVVPKDKNPLNPKNYNEDKLKKSTISAMLSDEETINKYFEIKTIVDNIKDINKNSKESSEYLKQIYEELKTVTSVTQSNSKLYRSQIDDNYSLSSANLQPIFKGF